MKLYIIGNGFDLAHGFNTSYIHYRNYIKSNLRFHPKWEQVLDYYPDDYNFWSDIEYNVCNFNIELYFSLKKLYLFGLLDDLLRQIHSSFEYFLLDTESKMFSSKPVFNLDKDSFFLSFNYTSTLEDLYGVPHENIIYVHNDISGPAMDIIYNIPNHTPCIIGHSPISNEYSHHNDNRLSGDVEYNDFVKSTVKQCQEIIQKLRIDNFLISHKEDFEEVVFYGFSFSISDKPYIQLIFSIIESNNIKCKIYYKVEDGSTNNECIDNFRNKLALMGINSNDIEFVNCDITKTI